MFYSTALPAVSISIELTCLQSASQCLNKIDSALANTNYPSRTWFKYKLLQMEALYNLGRVDELQRQLTPFLTNEDLPETFAVYIKIYYAKLLSQQGQLDTSTAYLNQAITLLNSIQDHLPRPMRMIEIANLQMLNQQYQEAEATLLLLEKRHAHYALPLFNQELYANLGHVAVRLGKLTDYVFYAEQSLKFAIRIGNKQQMAVAHYNLGRAFDHNVQLQQASEQYLHALIQARLSDDVATQVDALIRLTYIALKEKERDRVFEFLSNLENTTTSTRFNLANYTLYQSLMRDVKQQYPLSNQ